MINNFVKILEKIIKGRLVKVLETTNCYPKTSMVLDQGLEPKMTCTMQVNLFITHLIIIRKKISAIFLDLAKTTDRVNH